MAAAAASISRKENDARINQWRGESSEGKRVKNEKRYNRRNQRNVAKHHISGNGSSGEKATASAAAANQRTIAGGKRIMT